MLEVFQSILAVCKQDQLVVDNLVFRLHYRVIATHIMLFLIFHMQLSLILLIIFSALLTAKQHFGNPIDCFVQGIPGGIVDTYCWVHGTYTLTNYKMDQVSTLVHSIAFYSSNKYCNKILV